jgi:hypothetical protein
MGRAYQDGRSLGTLHLYGFIDFSSWVWKATSKPDPKQQQDWFLKWLHGGLACPLAACGVATLWCSPLASPLNISPERVRGPTRGVEHAPQGAVG